MVRSSWHLRYRAGRRSCLSLLKLPVTEKSLFGEFLILDAETDSQVWGFAVNPANFTSPLLAQTAQVPVTFIS